jgi:aminodeoxyfutalosine synthase
VSSQRSRITRAEALQLFRRAPLLELGRRAFDAKRARHADRITFVQNRHVNPTNLCVFSCRFCDFGAKPGDAHAYELTEDQVLDDLSSPYLTEAHIVGGLWPKWGFERSLGLVRRIRVTHPHISIKAFTAVEVAYFARMERQSVDTVLRRMLDAGIELMPGGGAEVLSERIHKELYKDKIGPAEWLAIHECAHRLGMPSNASILFGHIETDEEIIDHLFALRELQDHTGGYVSFIPLVYQPGDSGLVGRMVSAPRSLRVVALSRLVLDNIPHIKAYWPVLGEETAVTAMNFGADDMDGTLGKERIMQLAGSEAPEAQSAEHMARLIRLAGQEPAERDGRFGLVNRETATVVEC